MGNSDRHADSTISEELISPSGFYTNLQADLCAFTGTDYLCCATHAMAQWHHC
jgi:hypothetical protein